MIAVDLITFIFNLVILLSVSAMAGYLFYKLMPSLQEVKTGRLFRGLLYVILGWPFLIALISLLSFIYVGIISIFIVVLIFFVAIFYDFKFRKKSNSEMKAEINSVSLTVFLFLVLILSSYAVVVVSNYMGWPPIGDVATGNGPRVALVDINHKVPLYPSPYLILYPPGYSILCSAFNSIFATYPAIATFAVAGAILVTLALATYILSYLITKNVFLSLIPLSLVFLPSLDQNLERWAFGHFFNGTYPNLAGILLLMSFFICLFLFYTAKKHWSVWKFFVANIVYLVSLLFIYPGFLPFIIISILLSFFFLSPLKTFISDFYDKLVYFISVRKLISAFIISIIVIIVSLYITLLHPIVMNSYTVQVLMGYFTGTYVLGVPGFFLTHGSYQLPYSSILLDFRNIIAIIGLIFSFLMQSRNRFLASISISIAIFFLFLIPPLSDFSWILVSSRLLVFVQIIGAILFCRGLMEVGPHLKKLTINHTVGRITINRRFVASLTCLVLFFLIISPYLTLEQAKTAGWYTHTSYFQDDLKVMKFVNENVRSDELILDDGSFASQFIMSMSIKNMTCFDYVRVSNPELFSSVMYYWDNPWDLLSLYSLIEALNVSYVVSMSEPMRVNTAQSTGVLVYEDKPYNPETYSHILESAPFLRKIFSSGNSNVFVPLWTAAFFNAVFNSGLITSSSFWSSDSWGAGGIGKPSLSKNNSTVYIPDGPYSDFRVSHSFSPSLNVTKNQFMAIYAYSESIQGMSLFLLNSETVLAKFDFQLLPGIQQYSFPLNQIEGNNTNITEIAFATGWISPFPSSGNLFSINRLVIGEFSGEQK